MNHPPKEGAARPLCSSAPILPGQAAPAAPSVLDTLPGSRKTWAALAGFSYLLGWFYVRCMLLENLSGAEVWRWLVSSLVYMAAVAAAARSLGRRPGHNAAFWGACWALQGLAIGLWCGGHTGAWYGWQFLVWHLTAVYWTLAATGMQAAGKANTMVLLDGLAGLCTLPFGQFFLRVRVVVGGVRALWRRRRRGSDPTRRRRAWELLAGLALALILGAYALGELAAADAGFGALVDRWLRWPQLDDWTLMQVVEESVYLILSLPVGAWLFGLIGGGLRRQDPPVTEAKFYALLARGPKLPLVTARLAVGGLCLVYALFFAVQAAEFAAALGAPVPLTPLQVSTFAVEGFWQLCRILLLDFAVLAAVHFLCPRPADAPGRGRWGLAVFAAFGLAFAALAAAKLGLYLALYGPTPRRILSAWFLAVLMLGCVLALVRLFRRIPAVRILVAALALSFSLICCADIEGVCVDVHLDRVASGQTQTVDWTLLGDCCGWGSREALTRRTLERLQASDLSDNDRRALTEQTWLWAASY